MKREGKATALPLCGELLVLSPSDFLTFRKLRFARPIGSKSPTKMLML